MWDLALYIGLPFVTWQVAMYRRDWGKKPKSRKSIFARLNPWRLGWVVRFLAFPFGGNSATQPFVSGTADREQRLVHYEADRLIAEHKRKRGFGLRK